MEVFPGHMMTQLEQLKLEWSGIIASDRTAASVITMEAVLESQSESRGGSLPFKALGSDGNTYWIKMIHNPQSTINNRRECQ
jgi:hypothetical protein